MQIDCRYSPVIHQLVTGLHGAAMIAVHVSALPLAAALGSTVLLVYLGIRAHLDFRLESCTRIRGFQIWDQWSVLLLGASGQRRRVKVALPEVCYASEYLLVLRFGPAEKAHNLRSQKARLLVIVPGMVSKEHYCKLMSYLRFGVINVEIQGDSQGDSDSQGDRIVSRASSAVSG